MRTKFLEVTFGAQSQYVMEEHGPKGSVGVKKTQPRYSASLAGFTFGGLVG